MAMEPVKLWWKTLRGSKIFAWYMLPVSQPKAVVFMVHGHGEHSWRYLHWAKQFTYNGYVFLSWDHYGHGLSDGQRGHIRYYEQLLLEIDLAITRTGELFPNLPVILYGHSMGGNIAINYVIRRSSAVKLLIATAPWLELTHPAPRIVHILGTLMNVTLPFYPFKSPIRPEQISHVQEEVAKYATDPLVHGRITPRLYSSVVKAGKFAMSKAARVKIPTLLMHGTDDSITLPGATAKLANIIPNCTYIAWPGLYHELHNEVQRDEVFSRILDWIETEHKQNAI